MSGDLVIFGQEQLCHGPFNHHKARWVINAKWGGEMCMGSISMEVGTRWAQVSCGGMGGHALPSWPGLPACSLAFPGLQTPPARCLWD